MPNLTGLTGGIPYDGTVYNYRAYVWNGRDRMRVNDRENWRLAGIVRDSFTPTVATQGTGLTGTYRYFVVPVNSSHQVYGNRVKAGLPSTISAAITVNNQGVRVGNIPATHADAQVDKWYIYRNKSGTYDGTVQDESQDFWYSGSVTLGTTTYDDTVADNDLPPETLDFRTNIPPAFKYGEVFGERLFGAGFDPITAGTATVNASTTLIDFTSVTIPDGVVGCWFQKDGQAKRYVITLRNSSSQVTPDSAFVGALSAGTYSIYRDNSEVWFSEFRDFDAWGPNAEAYRNKIFVGARGRSKPITGMKALNGALYVFTIDEIYRIYGQGPEPTAVKISPQPIFSGLGAVGGRALWVHDNEMSILTLRGPAVFTGDGPPRLIGEKLGTSWIDALNTTQLNLSCIGSDGRTIKFAVPQGSETENSLVYVYDRYTDTWWTEEYVHPAFYFYDLDSDGSPALFYGQGKYIVQDNTGGNDGVPSGTVTGTVTTGGTTSFSDSAASFYTTGGGLEERYVHVYRSGVLVGHRRLVSNTATQVSWSSSGSGGGTLTVSIGDTYDIGAVTWDWTSKTFSSPGMAARTAEVNFRFDLQGESTPSTLHKTDRPGDVLTSTPHAIVANENSKTLPVNLRDAEYAYKIEGRTTNSEVAIREITVVGIEKKEK